MSEQHSYRAKIHPVLETTFRPLWSVMIPTYNCANYLRETLASVLAQDPGSDVMQIEIIDDCSTKDDPKAIVEELGKGRVEFYQQPQNVGYIKNFETCLQRSRGHLIHLLHGDDCVRDGFYQKLQHIFDQHSEVGAVFCRHLFMDEQSHWQNISPLHQSESGILANWLERVVVDNPIQTPSIAVRREVYERLGGFDRRFVCCCEDWEMWVRIAAHYAIGYEVEPLAAYRLSRHGSLTRGSVRSGKYAQDVRKANEIIGAYLPEMQPSRECNHLLQQGRQSSALGILNLTQQMLDSGDSQSAFNQFQEVRKLSTSGRVNKRLTRLAFRAMAMQFKHQIKRITK